MTYLTFHLVFLAPPILLMGMLYRQPQHLGDDIRVTLAIPVVCLLALSYTTPWDNYLVAREIWWYGPDRVVGTIGHVPIEEYLFFVLQPLLTGLFLYQYLGRYAVSPKPSSSRAAWGGAAIFGALTGIGILCLLSEGTEAQYMGLILAWAPPILAGMWLYDGETLWSLRSTVSIATAVPTVYLWVADAVAIGAGIWTISPSHTLGVSAFGLPLEEATFFLFTNLLVVHGVLLLLYGSHKAVIQSKSLP